MIDPNMASAEDRNTITISHGSPTKVRRRASNHGITGPLAVVNMQPMYDNVCNVLDRDASPVCDMNVNSASINCFETVHDQFLF
ncbi:hypothetical protein HanRHA438_Chr04g0179201 [Helianthus annuus]|nr:hypothetical protein HanRHA438_Chr04g0179201 [Helianthus annuus]